MTVKTDISRFQIHDELTAPDASARLLQGMASAGGAVSKFVGVLAGAPSALRAFARMRHELRGGVLAGATRERIALAVAEDRGDPYSIAQHAKTARSAGLGLDEIPRARSWSSADPREARLLAQVPADSPGVGAAIDHPGPDVAATILQRHPRPARQMAMGDPDRPAAQPLAAGGAVAEEARPVPGGDALGHRAGDLPPGPG